MKCPKCGAWNTAYLPRCTRCGAPLEENIQKEQLPWEEAMHKKKPSLQVVQFDPEDETPVVPAPDGDEAFDPDELDRADLDDVRDNVAEVREEADNAYIWNDKVHRILGLWDDDGQLRTRAWDAPGSSEEGKENAKAAYLQARGGNFRNNSKLSDFKIISVGSGDSGGAIKTYTINVKSAGPDQEFDTWDDIWSFPDDFN